MINLISIDHTLTMPYSHILLPDLSKDLYGAKKFSLKRRHTVSINSLDQYSNEKYLSWDKVRYLELPSDCISHEELWFVIRSFRYGRPTPIKNLDGNYFTFKKVDFLRKFRHNFYYDLGEIFLTFILRRMNKKYFSKMELWRRLSPRVSLSEHLRVRRLLVR